MEICCLKSLKCLKVTCPSKGDCARINGDWLILSDGHAINMGNVEEFHYGDRDDGIKGLLQMTSGRSTELSEPDAEIVKNRIAAHSASPGPAGVWVA